jgi:hypothetical protein
MSLGKDGPPPHGGSQSNSNTEKVDHSLAPLDVDKTRLGGLLSPPRMISFMQRMQRIKRLQSQATSARVQVDQKIMEASNSRRHVSLCDASLMKAVQIMAAEGKFNGSEELLALYEECQKARDVLGPIEEEEFEERGNWFEKMWKLKELEESFYDDFEEEFQAADTYSPGSPSVDSRYYESPSEHEAQILNLQFDQHFNKSLESILPLPASLSVSSKDEPSPHQQQSLSENMTEEVQSVSSKYEPSPHQNQPSSESIVEEVPQYLPKFDRLLPLESNTSVSDSNSQCTDSNVSLDGPLTEEKETQVFDYDSRSSTDFDREQRDPPPITWLNADPDEAVHTLPGIELYPELLTQFVTKRERVTKWLLQTTLLSPMDASLLKRRLDSENPKSPSNWAQLVIAWWDKDKSATAKPKVARRDNESGTAQAHPKSVAEQRVVTKPGDEISRNSTFPPSKVPSIQNPEPSVSNENPQSLQYLLSPGNDPMGPEPTSFSEAVYEFSTLLFDHEDLKPIFSNSPKVLDASTFVRILKIVLEGFSRDLIKEAKNLTERATAHFVRDSRQKVAKALGGRLYGSSLNEPVTSVLDNPEQYYTDIAPFPQLPGKDEISDDGENDDNYAFPSWKEMKLFILESGALSSFRSAFEQLQMADQDWYQTLWAHIQNGKSCVPGTMADHDWHQILWAHIQNGKVPGTGVDSGYESSVISGNIGILADHSGEEISKMPVSSVEIAAVAGAEQQSSATDTPQGLFTSRPDELGPVDPPSATTAQILKPQNRQVEIAPLSSNVVLRPGPEDATDLPQNQPDIANGNITSHIVSPTADPTLDTTMHITRKLSTFGPDLEVHPPPIILLSRNKADVYPTAWSPWEWNDTWQMESRWRQVRANGEEGKNFSQMLSFSFKRHLTPLQKISITNIDMPMHLKSHQSTLFLLTLFRLSQSHQMNTRNLQAITLTKHQATRSLLAKDPGIQPSHIRLLTRTKCLQVLETNKTITAFKVRLPASLAVLPPINLRLPRPGIGPSHIHYSGAKIDNQ